MSTGEWLYTSFNQDYSCFTVGTTTGFIVYDTAPVVERFQVIFDKGVGIVEILRDSNIVALVGGGTEPAFPPNKVVLWDDSTTSTLAEIQCPSIVCGVKLQLDKLVIALASHIFIYDTRNMSLIKKYETFPNPRGVVVVSGTLRQTLNVATPDDHKGHVRMEKFNPQRVTAMRAHEGALRAICLSRDGQLLATTSDTGTLIRVFDASPGSVGKQLLEFRRGSDQADIFSMAFSPDNSFLIVNSDKFDAHVFAIAKPALNQTSTLSGWGLGGYMASVWSAACIPLPEVFATVSFVSEKDVVVLCHDRSYYKYELTEQDGKLVVNRRGYLQLNEQVGAH